MSKYIKFQVSEDRFTKLKKYGFERIDQYMNNLIDQSEQMEKENGRKY